MEYRLADMCLRRNREHTVKLARYRHGQSILHHCCQSMLISLAGLVHFLSTEHVTVAVRTPHCSPFTFEDRFIITLMRTFTCQRNKDEERMQDKQKYIWVMYGEKKVQ